MATQMAYKQARARVGRVHTHVAGLIPPAEPRQVRTIADPDLVESVRAAAARLRSDKKALLDHYVRLGILTPGGNLTKKFGG